MKPSDLFVLVLGFVVAVVLCIGGWLLYWKLSANATDRSTHILQHSYGANQGEIDGARDKISDLTGLPDGPQKTAIINQACALIADLTGNVPSDLASFQSQECHQ